MCVWGKGGGQAKEVAFQQTGFPKQTKMKFSLKRPRDSLGPAFISLCNLIFVGLFDKSQSPRGQTLDLACSAGPAPGPMPVASGQPLLPSHRPLILFASLTPF